MEYVFRGQGQVALGIESDRADLRPVTRVARPAFWVALPGLNVEVMASRQDGLVFAFVALLRPDVAYATVAVINVVPTHEFSRPGPGVIQSGEALGGEFRAAPHWPGRVGLPVDLGVNRQEVIS